MFDLPLFSHGQIILIFAAIFPVYPQYLYKMKTFIVLACICSALSVALAQFPNGRILEPPVPALCAQRNIHERAPDGKG